MFDFDELDIDLPEIEDCTCDMPDIQWIEPYERADGTAVAGHYRTVADDCLTNNLG